MSQLPACPTNASTPEEGLQPQLESGALGKYKQGRRACSMQVAKQFALAVVTLQTSSYLCSWVCLRTFCTQDLKSDDTLKNSLLCCRGARHAAYLSCNPKTSGSFKGVEVWNEKLKVLETGWLCFTTLLVLPHPQKTATDQNAHTACAPGHAAKALAASSAGASCRVEKGEVEGGVC